MSAPRRVEISLLVQIFSAVCCVVLLTGRNARPHPPDAATSQRSAPPGRPVRVGRLVHPGIRESSGIVASRKFPGVYWTMNDSGNAPRLYAVDATGRTLRVVSPVGASNRDWEDIAADAQGKIYVADVGNNARGRKVLSLYVLTEPDPRGNEQAAVERICRFRYPPGHGPYDCESMFVRKGRAYLITKQADSARLYRVALDAPAKQIVEAEYLGLMPEASALTAADISPDGRRIAALSYSTIYVYDLPDALENLIAPASPPASGPAAAGQAVCVRPGKRRGRMGQAEAICWVVKPPTAELLITNEQRGIFRVRAAVGSVPTSAPGR